MGVAAGITVAGNEAANSEVVKKYVQESARAELETSADNNPAPVDMSKVKVETMDDIYQRRVDEAFANYKSQVERLFPEHAADMVSYLKRTIAGKKYEEQEQIIGFYLADALKRSK